MDIKDRIIEFLRTENISSANFAQELGVQPSGISHIFSGRNKPSLDFIVKMLNRYPYLSSDWLLFGKGQMTKEKLQEEIITEKIKLTTADQKPPDLFDMGKSIEFSSLSANSSLENKENITDPIRPIKKRHTSRVVIFYDDNTFSEFFPG